MAKTADEHALDTRAELARERAFLTEQETAHKAAKKRLQEREKNVQRDAEAMVQADIVEQQNDRDAKLAYRIVRQKVGPNSPIPSPEDVAAALQFYGASGDLWRHTYACMTPDIA